MPVEARPVLACPWDGSAELDWPGRAGARCRRCGRLTLLHRGVWEALGPWAAPTSAAQLVHRLGPVAWGYERLWRVRSLGVLARRPFPVAEELASLGSALGRVAGKVVVDVGCSEGLYARPLAASGATVVAVDHSRAFLRRVVVRAGAAGLTSIAPVRALAQHLPVRSGSVDAVVSGGSLNEIGDQRAALAEAARVLTPGGRLFSMSLAAAAGRPGQDVQRLLGATGITFPTVDETVALLPTDLQPLELLVDGIVVRLTAVKSG